MAKKSVKNRNQRRVKLVEKFRVLRKKLRDDSVNVNLTDEERIEAMHKLNSLPRDTSPSRRRNRCKICGRPRAFNRRTGTCRLHMTQLVRFGMVPGMRKSSW